MQLNHSSVRYEVWCDQLGKKISAMHKQYLKFVSKQK
jgi:hypothetical protein